MAWRAERTKGRSCKVEWPELGQTSPLNPDFAGAQSGLRSPRTFTETGLNAFGTARIGRAIVKENIMSNGNSPSLAEFEQRIAIARDNIRQLIEQAAAVSGAEDEIETRTGSRNNKKSWKGSLSSAMRWRRRSSPDGAQRNPGPASPPIPHAASRHAGYWPDLTPTCLTPGYARRRAAYPQEGTARG